MPVLWCLECPDQKPESNFTTHNQRSGILSNIAPVVAALKPCLGWDDALLLPKLLLPTFSYHNLDAEGYWRLRLLVLGVHDSMTVLVLDSRPMG